MPIALIAAAAGEKLVIGKDGDLPWHFPSDLKFFKQKTLGHSVVMGRVTYQSILNRLGKPLPGRKNIVLTRDKNFRDERVTIIHDPAVIPTLANKDDLLCVIGGAKVYNETIGYADILYITHIDRDIEGDAFFPPIDKSKWELTAEIPLIENGVALRFCTYQKV